MPQTERTEPLDVEYLGHSRVIASCLLESDGELALVDPGPAVSLPVLKKKLGAHGIGIGDLTALFLTHIHLDHAGATGTLLRENPRLRVYVHEFGARHLKDPSRLLASASRLYGDAMPRLFGEFLPVPPENMIPLHGGEVIQIGSRRWEILYTPGHASHHVTFFEPSSGQAFVGDTSGIRVSGQPFVLPVTPPPDVNLESWRESVDLILSRHPSRLFLTHFGWAEDPAPHFDEFWGRLIHWSEQARDSLAGKEDDAHRARAFSEWGAAELHQHLRSEEAERYVRTGGLDLSWMGLARYWRKKVSPAPQPMGN